MGFQPFGYIHHYLGENESTKSPPENWKQQQF